MKTIFCVLMLFAAACSGGDVKPAAASTLAEQYWVAAAPAGTTTISALRAGAQDHGDAAVRGRVKDFIPGLGAFTMTDPEKVKPCNEAGPMDACATPWDYCCDDPKEVAAASATVEFREGGRPVRAEARGFHGIDHLKYVVVVGSYEKDASGNLTIIAKGVHVQP